MRTPIRRPPLAVILAPLVAALLLCLALLPNAAHGAIHYTNESFEAFEGQLKAHQISEVTINKRVRSLRITLTNGEHVLAKYKAHEEAKVREQLQHKHVRVTVLTPEQAKTEVSKIPVHHKLRYIAGGIVIAVVVIVGGVVFYNRRRRARAEF
jgi:ABC-type arginine transport system ATPase subunit